MPGLARAADDGAGACFGRVLCIQWCHRDQLRGGAGLSKQELLLEGVNYSCAR